MLPRCAGDCDGSGHVTMDEILTLLAEALGDGDLGMCAADAAANGDAVTVAQILGAVDSALLGCPSR